MKISSKTIFIFSPVAAFLAASFIWYLILYQSISFLSGLIIMIFLFFFLFSQNFLSLRKSEELIGLKSKKQIIIVSAVFVLGMAEIIWSVSFLPFPFFILGGIIAIIFGAILDIYKEYFKNQTNYGQKIEKILARDVISAVILIIIFISITSWLPPKIY